MRINPEWLQYRKEQLVPIAIYGPLTLLFIIWTILFGGNHDNMVIGTVMSFLLSMFAFMPIILRDDSGIFGEKIGLPRPAFIKR